MPNKNSPTTPRNPEKNPHHPPKPETGRVPEREPEPGKPRYPEDRPEYDPTKKKPEIEPKRHHS